MKFEQQVKEAKAKKLEYRILRDAIFIILGIVFLIISIFSAYAKKQDNFSENSKEKKVITTTIAL